MRPESVTKQQVGNKVLGVMVAWESDENRVWTPEQLWSKLRAITRQQVKTALEWLLRAGYVERAGDHEWSIMREGRQAYEDAKLTNSRDLADTREFRNEALTGMDKDGEQTEIKNGALPCQSKHVHDVELRNVGMCDLSTQLEEIAQRFGKTVEFIVEAKRHGLVEYCTGCNRVALFHAHRSQRDGFRRQSECILCIKARRQKERNKSWLRKQKVYK